MRRILIGDLVAAGRVLLHARPVQRPALMRRLLRAAALADAHRRRRGRPHPRFGSGSLMAAAAAWPQSREPFLDDADYLEALGCVVQELRARAGRGSRSASGPRDIGSGQPRPRLGLALGMRAVADQPHNSGGGGCTPAAS